MNLLIPYMAVGQTIQGWKGIFVASTVTLTVAQKLEILPNFVNRNPGEQELAKIAAKKTTVDAAFKELARLVDGKTDNLSDFKDYIDTRLGCSEIAAQKVMLFDLVRKGTEAAIPTDIICKKFFAEIPEWARLDESNKDKVAAGMVVGRKRFRNPHAGCARKDEEGTAPKNGRKGGNLSWGPPGESTANTFMGKRDGFRKKGYKEGYCGSQ